VILQLAAVRRLGHTSFGNMKPQLYHLLATILLAGWGLFAAGLAVNPRLVVRLLLQNRVALSKSKTMVIRVFGAITVIGVVFKLWTGLY